MSHERGGSYVMDRDGCFQFVRGYVSKPIGTEIEIRPLIQPVAYYTRVAAIAACLILAISLGSFAWLWNTENYYAYVDINPSIELVFNNINRLKAANPLNEEGAILLQGIKLKGKPGDALIALLNEAKQQGYISSLDDLAAVSIMISGKGNNKTEKYLTAIRIALADQGMLNLVELDACSEEYRKKAIALGVSPGKLKLAEQLFIFDQSMSIDELVKMTVNDLLVAIISAEKKSFLSDNEQNIDNLDTDFEQKDEEVVGNQNNTESDLIVSRNDITDAAVNSGINTPLANNKTSDINEDEADIVITETMDKDNSDKDIPLAEWENQNKEENSVVVEKTENTSEVTTDTRVTDKDNDKDNDREKRETDTKDKSGGETSIPKTNVYKVTYILDNEESFQKNYSEGAPPQPEKEGYIFNGWFTAAVGGDKWDFSTIINSNIKLYAQWTLDGSGPGEPTGLKVSISFVGIEEVTIKYLQTNFLYGEVGEFSDNCEFYVPEGTNILYIYAIKGGMSYTFAPNTFTEPLDLAVPLKSITVGGINTECALSIYQDDIVYDFMPAEVGADNIFTVFANDAAYEVLLSKNGFYPLSIANVKAGNTVNFGIEYFYQITIPEGITNLNMWSKPESELDSLIVEDACAGDTVTLLRDPLNEREAMMTYIYNDELYEIRFVLDGANPFNNVAPVEEEDDQLLAVLNWETLINNLCWSPRMKYSE